MTDNKMHLGHSPLTDNIYLGKQKGNHWVGEKRDVTNEFIQVMLQKFEPNTVKGITIDGKLTYNVIIVPVDRKVTVDGIDV